MTVALAAILAAGILLPHLLRLRRVAPVTATVLWLTSLALRALTGFVAVTFLLFVLPRTDVFESLTHWCLHTVLPGLAAELDVEGHGMGDVSLFVPGIVLALSLLIACVRTARDAGAARRLVDSHVLGPGPGGSIIVSGPEVAFAVAGLARPRIVVSAGALASLDDAELAAGLDHERGHIARHHRFVVLLTAALSALGWVVPGTRRAAREIRFHLERDADLWALDQRNDRLALASVICKAATSAHPPGSAALARLGETGVRERLGLLLEDQPRPSGLPSRAALNALAAAMVAFTVLLAAALPAAAVAGARADAHEAHHAHCDH
jgi:Zn-dependent protease with chaperone function